MQYMKARIGELLVIGFTTEYYQHEIDKGPGGFTPVDMHDVRMPHDCAHGFAPMSILVIHGKDEDDLTRQIIDISKDYRQAAQDVDKMRSKMAGPLLETLAGILNIDVNDFKKAEDTKND